MPGPDFLHAAGGESGPCWRLPRDISGRRPSLDHGPLRSSSRRGCPRCSFGETPPRWVRAAPGRPTHPQTSGPGAAATSHPDCSGCPRPGAVRPASAGSRMRGTRPGYMRGMPGHALRAPVPGLRPGRYGEIPSSRWPPYATRRPVPPRPHSWCRPGRRRGSAGWSLSGPRTWRRCPAARPSRRPGRRSGHT